MYRPDVETTLARYAQAWTTDDPDDRWALVHACAAPEVVYLGPESDKPVLGQAALAAFLGLPRALAAVEIGPPDGHHTWLRAGCRWTTSEGASTGLLVARLDAENRMVEILHFDD